MLMNCYRKETEDNIGGKIKRAAERYGNEKRPCKAEIMQRTEGMAGRMGKNIVVFSDGTGQEGGKGNNSNVYKLFNDVLDRSPKQIAFYFDGRTGRADANILRTIVKTFYRAGSAPVAGVEREPVLSLA